MILRPSRSPAETNSSGELPVQNAWTPFLDSQANGEANGSPPKPAPNHPDLLPYEGRRSTIVRDLIVAEFLAASPSASR